jgi:hypothetical protein
MNKDQILPHELGKLKAIGGGAAIPDLPLGRLSIVMPKASTIWLINSSGPIRSYRFSAKNYLIIDLAHFAYLFNLKTKILIV